MSFKIQVEPQALEHNAKKIEQHCAQYEQEYQKLYQNIDALQNSWQGSDHLAYTAQIRAFQQDFQKMVLLMRQYADFLQQSAKSYRSVQEDRRVKARLLTR